MYTGLTGKVTVKIKNESVNSKDVASSEVAYISNWSVDTSTDIIEITQLGKNYKEKVPGLQSWSASADGAVSFESGKSHEIFFKAKRDGLPVEVAFYLDQATIGERDIYFSGVGYIDSLTVDLSAGDKGNISISISGAGELQLSELSSRNAY